MYKMNGTVIYKDDFATIAKIELTAIDARTGNEDELTLYTDFEPMEEESTKILAERILKKMGYSLTGIQDVQRRHVRFNAEQFWNEGLLK